MFRPGRLRLGYDLFGEIEDLLTTGQVGAAARNANAGRHLEEVEHLTADDEIHICPQSGIQ